MGVKYIAIEENGRAQKLTGSEPKVSVELQARVMKDKTKLTIIDPSKLLRAYNSAQSSLQLGFIRAQAGGI